MDPGFQQVWGLSTPVSVQSSHLVTQHDDDPEGLSSILTDCYDYDWNNVRCSHIATNVPNQVISSYNSQPHLNPGLHSGLVRPYHAPSATSLSFGQSSGVDLSLSAIDAECQLSATHQSFQQILLFRPQYKSTVKLNSILVPYSDTSCETFSGFE